MKIPTLFGSFEEICKRKGFDDKCIISLNNFKGIVGQYNFKEPVRCQAIYKACACGNLHNKGFVAVTKDGKEGVVGWCCGKKKFGAQSDFVVQAKRVERQLRRIQVVEQLDALLANGNFFETLKKERERLKMLEASIEKFKGSLPRKAFSALRNMAKTGETKVEIELLYKERDEAGGTIKWVAQTVGRIHDTEFLLDTLIQKIYHALNDIKRNYEADLQTSDVKLKVLEQRLKVLRTLPVTSQAISDLEQRFTRFCDGKNLSLMMHMVRDHKDKATIAALALSGGKSSGKSKEANSLVKMLSKEVQNRYGDRIWRPRA